MAVLNSSRFDFAEVVQKMLQDYGYEVFDEVFEGLNEVSKETVSKLKKESAAKFGRGKYSQGWMRTVEKGRLKAYAVVHGNKNTYPLAHLLEKGHAMRTGGRVAGRIHIEPVNEWAQDEALDRIVSKLEGRL